MGHLLGKELPPKEREEAAQNLIHSANLLLDLLNEVMEMTKLASNELPVYEVKFSLKTLVNNLCALLMPSAKEKNLQLNVRCDSAIPPYMMGDQLRLHRILLNLVSNAIKFTAQGQVDIDVALAQQEGNRLIFKIQVKDTGMGISPEHKEIIFTRFTRLEASYKGQQSGHGLGLAIVKQFIHDLEGEIYVESEAGKGSVFTCVLPFKKALLDEADHASALSLNAASFHAAEPAQSLAQPGTKAPEISEMPARLPEIKTMPTANRRRVLLVEDNRIAQFGAKHLLEDLSCEVITADTGEQALELYPTTTFDVVFMDIGLPGKDGCEVTRELIAYDQEQGRSPTPIVALTAHIDKDNEQLCLAAGMQQVLTKPLQVNSAREILQRFAPSAPIPAEPEATTESEPLPVIDLAENIARMGGDEAAAKEMLRALIQTLPRVIDEVQSAYKADDLVKLRFAVHQFHGGLCYCGTPRLRAAAKAVLDLLAVHFKAEPDLKEAYNALYKEMGQVLQAYEDLK